MSTPLNTLKNVNKHYLIALERAGLNTVEKLCTMTYSGLKAVKGLGVIGPLELVRALNEMGLRLMEE